MPRKEDKRVKVSGTIDDKLYNWLEKKIGERSFYNQSHAIELGLKRLMDEDNGQGVVEKKGRGHNGNG